MERPKLATAGTVAVAALPAFELKFTSPVPFAAKDAFAPWLCGPEMFSIPAEVFTTVLPVAMLRGPEIVNWTPELTAMVLFSTNATGPFQEFTPVTPPRAPCPPTPAPATVSERLTLTPWRLSEAPSATVTRPAPRALLLVMLRMPALMEV